MTAKDNLNKNLSRAENYCPLLPEAAGAAGAAGAVAGLEPPAAAAAAAAAAFNRAIMAC